MIKINLNNIEAEDKHALVLELEHIAELIDGGYTSGVDPIWSLEGEEEKLKDEENEREFFIRSQSRYCDVNKVPMFAPSDGICFYCHSDCTSKKWVVEHITGCNKCHHTFCD